MAKASDWCGLRSHHVLLEAPLKIDFSKASALHRLYGHNIFAMEAEKAKKDVRFMAAVCRGVNCDGKSNDWRNRLGNSAVRPYI